MNDAKTVVLSASRRTDIPAFYLDWFMKGIDQGFMEVTNPYTRKTRKILVKNDNVHSIVFWSKDYDALIRSGSGNKLLKQGYNLYFNFTINSECAVLEPGIPELSKRLEQLKELCSRFGPDKIAWRFDPLCFFSIDNGPEQNNLSDFEKIVTVVSDLGIKKCITSFFDPYRKIDQRLTRFFDKNGQKIVFNDISLKKQKKIIQIMADYAVQNGIALYLCCEQELFSHIDLGSHVFENACIDGSLLKRLYGGTPETRRDYGQRSDHGCKCTRSIDIGSYNLHPCLHNCLYCYANPDMDSRSK